MVFHKDNKYAEIYKDPSGEWRIKNNCPQHDFDFHILSFVYPYWNNYGLEEEWFEFFVDSVRTFRLVVDPYNKNATLTHPRPLFNSEW